MAFSNDGTKMFVIGSNGDEINEYDLHSVYSVMVTGTYTVLPGGAFATTWKTTSAGESISIPVEIHTGGTLTIDWGDGGAATTVTTSGTQTHPYSAFDEYQVSMTGDLSRINLGASDSTASKLISIDQWGDIEWTSMENMFKGASNMEYRATDAPDLSGVTTTASMFGGASSFDGDISSWNVSPVTDMNSMFSDAAAFDQSLNGWDVSSVIDMEGMFFGADAFNSALNGWDVSSVTDMTGMFGNTAIFDQPLNGWNVSSVTDMEIMFSGASSFDRPLNGWNVSSVTDTNRMFSNAAAFNQPLNDWDVSSVTNMRAMFSNAAVFDGDISDWNVAKVNTMESMFQGSSFNGDISRWNVTKVVSMQSMFEQASSFNQPLNDWDVSSVTYMQYMFDGADSFEQNLGKWYIVPGDTLYDAATETSLIITTIAPANTRLNTHIFGYGIGTGGDSDLFKMTVENLMFKDAPPPAGVYTVNVTTTDGTTFGTGNHRVLNVTVTGQIPSDTAPPTFVSSGLDLSTGALTITFSEEIDATPATNVVPTKIHVRESGSYTGGITLAAGELDTAGRRRHGIVYPDYIPPRNGCKTDHAGTDDRPRGGAGHV